MTRFWLGAGILLALLLTGAVLGTQMVHIHEELSRQLSEAAELAMEEKWQEAAALSGRAMERWRQHRRFAASLTDHEPLEDMDRLFDQLLVYEAQHMTAEYAALCRLLSRQAEAMGEGHRLTWWNFW